MIGQLFFLCAVFAAYAEAGDIPPLDGKIVGGQEATINEYPYQASIQYFSNHMCGGSIIAKRFILTAAHCTDGLRSTDLQVRVGSSFHTYGGQLIGVKKIHQHPFYSASTINYDISILELVQDLAYGATIQQVGLPRTGEYIPVGSNSVVSGWGTLIEGGSAPSKLQAVFIPTISNEQCSTSYGGGGITENMMCAGIIDIGKKDACQGDSGGPLVYNGKQIGIVSWGYGCARPKYPGVYSNVCRLRPFIDQVLQSAILNI